MAETLDSVILSDTLDLMTDPYFIERGPRYNAYAQLRESKLQSKRLKFDEDEQIPEIPISDSSPLLKKTVRFQEDFEDEQITEIPKSEFSPLMKKTVRFQRTFEDEQIPEIPKSEISPLLKKTVRFQRNFEDEQIPEIPKSEFSPLLKKTIRYQGNNKKQGYSVLAQSVPDFSSALRKENRKPSDNRIPRVEKSATPPPLLSKKEKMYGSGSKLAGLGSKSVSSGEKQSSGKLMMMGRKSYASIEELKGLSIAASNSINGEKRGAKRGGNVLRKSTVFSTRYY